MNEKFMDDLAKALVKQYKWCKAYRKECEKRGYSIKEIVRLVENDELGSLPSIGSNDWKRSRGLFKNLANTKVDGKWIVSSSTSGDPSYRWCTREDLVSVSKSCSMAFRKIPFADIGLVFSPPMRFLEESSKRFRIDDEETEMYALYPFRSALKTFEKAEFLYDPVEPKGKRVGQEGGPRFQFKSKLLADALKDAEKNGSTVVLGPSVLFLYPVIAQSSNERKYNFGNRIYVSTGAGGWNGRKGVARGEPVPKPTYVEALVDWLGISDPEKQIMDTYGTTENGKAQSGFYRHRWRDFVFDVGEDTKLLIVDPITKEPLGVGERGVPKFISPYGFEGSAGVVMEQEDDSMTVVSTFEDKTVKQYTHVSKLPKPTGFDSGDADGCAFDWLSMVSKRYFPAS
ncbi:MAG: hypothetical protein JTT11_05405 [Candidatus Brockarchaeota archaeon]|nr:hypothetical protein [Candidatus Brockarchaeota archaeon]